jgi:hypothetical protein
MTTNTIGLKILHQCAVDMVELFCFAKEFPGSGAARLVLTYRASCQGMDRCFTRDDFWRWNSLAAECDIVLQDNGVMLKDEGTL